eukprot:4194117-Pyramimonas_sp.AAC.1
MGRRGVAWRWGGRGRGEGRCLAQHTTPWKKPPAARGSARRIWRPHCGRDQLVYLVSCGGGGAADDDDADDDDDVDDGCVCDDGDGADDADADAAVDGGG